MDIIQQCLSLAPAPYLAPAFSALRFICISVEQAQASKWQLKALAQSIAQLLQTLDREYRDRRLLLVRTYAPLADLIRLLDEISSFVQKETSCPFLKLLFTKDQRITQIEGYYRRISVSVQSFQISALLNIHAWQSRNNGARAADRRVLNERLLQLETNHQRLMELLYTHQDDMMAMMVSLQRRLDHQSDGDRERRFFSHALRFLTTCSGRQVEIESWMITSYEVEFGPKIGSGGFGQVFKGTWNKTPVALKVLSTEAGVTPSSAVIRREIRTWSMLRHTHVLQFLGANEFDDKPFIVMPYLKNGNARDYVNGHPGCNRLQIVMISHSASAFDLRLMEELQMYHVALGLVYLHSLKIVHGDLKAVNVLIDDGGNAVLCDFGLSHIKADATSRTARGWIVGSRNWMSPEQLQGGSLKKPCDIYAFGMTLYEIFSNTIPLGHLNYGDLFNLVVRNGVRPERPDYEEAPQLSDGIWQLAEKCWMKDPNHRPTSSAMCDRLSYLLETAPITRPLPIPSSSHTIAFPRSVHLRRQRTRYIGARTDFAVDRQARLVYMV